MDPIQESSIDWVPIAVGFITVILSGIVSYFVSRFTTKFSQDKEYENNYYKTIIEYRLESYKIVDSIISAFHPTTPDSDKRSFHFFCKSKEAAQRLQICIVQLSKSSMWLTQNMLDATRDLSDILYHCDISSDEAVLEFGKSKYKRLADLREKIQKVYLEDMCSLHKVSEFLSQKKNLGFVTTESRGLNNNKDSSV